MTKLYLLHGAGAGHQSAFLADFKGQFEQQSGLSLAPITLAYMRQIETTGARRPPPAINKLVQEVQQMIDPNEPIILIAKSMGCRISAELCKSHKVLACIALGFPFYPAKKPEKHRLAHLDASQPVPYLVLQGTRDSLGSPEWVTQQTLPANVHMHWIEGADHDFKALKRYNRSAEDILQELVGHAQAFVQTHLGNH